MTTSSMQPNGRRRSKEHDSVFFFLNLFPAALPHTLRKLLWQNYKGQQQLLKRKPPNTSTMVEEDISELPPSSFEIYLPADLVLLTVLAGK